MQASAPYGALAPSRKSHSGRNWLALAAIGGAAILGAVILVAEFGSEQNSAPEVASSPAADAQPSGPITVVPFDSVKSAAALLAANPSISFGFGFSGDATNAVDASFADGVPVLTSSPAKAAAPAKEPSKMTVSASSLSAAQERALKPGDTFSEYAGCPEMVVVPAGSFTMGSPPGQGSDDERPQHKVAIAQPFAVAKFALTFDEWDSCAAQGDCAPPLRAVSLRPDGTPVSSAKARQPAKAAAHVSDNGWGRGQRPAINVSWDDAQTYVKWLSSITGKSYRLLSEAEYEYATRAGSQTPYPWADDIKPGGKAMANCQGCGSQWDNKQTAPVGSFAPNKFGLYDMVGNVWEWVEDCWNTTYKGAPADGSAWTNGDCNIRVERGGAWNDDPDILLSANRHRNYSDIRSHDLGFRVARTLNP